MSRCSLEKTPLTRNIDMDQKESEAAVLVGMYLDAVHRFKDARENPLVANDCGIDVVDYSEVNEAAEHVADMMDAVLGYRISLRVRNGG